MPLMCREHVSLSWDGYMVTDEKCDQIVLHVYRLTISTNMSVLGVPHNDFETRYSWKHDCISKDLYLHLFYIQMRMPMVVTMVMTVTITVMMDVTIPLFSSVRDGREGNVKVWHTSVVQDIAGASVM